MGDSINLLHLDDILDLYKYESHQIKTSQIDREIENEKFYLIIQIKKHN